jgi:hypothetical protein
VELVKRSLLVLTVAALTGGGAASFISACSSDSSSAPAGGGGSDATTGSDAPATDAATDGGRPDGATAASTCEITRAFILDCNQGSDAGDQLTCGAAKFDAWCALNDQAINSEAYRRAEALCLTHASCTNATRADCEDKSLAMDMPTTAQKNVVAAYCQTCEPADPAGCAMRKTAYDPAKGPDSTDDVYIAAWELNDALTDQIRTKCTGTALDGGIEAQLDAGGVANPCLKAFGNCAGDIYVNALPDCPK